jgi:hypothetical protein
MKWRSAEVMDSGGDEDDEVMDSGDDEDDIAYAGTAAAMTDVYVAQARQREPG